MIPLTPPSSATDAAPGLHQQVRALLPALRARAPQAKSLRRLPDQTIADLKACGFFRALLPRQFGGMELPPAEFFRLQVMLGEACMSTAWAGGIIAVHPFQIALMDRRAQDDVFGSDPDTLVSSAYAPVGRVSAVEGGFRLSGRWAWSSGSDHCSWALLGAIVPGDGYRTFLVPRSDYRVEDTWHSMGLQGTGSNDIVVQDAFVPHHRTHRQSDGFRLTNPGVTPDSHPMYRIPWGQLFVRTVSCAAIGAAKAALELHIAGVKGPSSNDPTKLAADVDTQRRIAEAAHCLDEIEVVMYRNLGHLMDRAAAGEDVSMLDRIKFRYQASVVIEKCLSVVDSLFSVAGGRSVYSGSEIQQRFLDLHVARAHIANHPVPFARNFGSALLGGENQDFFL
ncbi:flavin-dependent monooxygenase [Solimonas fluminis]|uniref:Flavin-dependent monooxygenase n=1 Tax=Solimonas fluminis TaxID=2086571 RepID=A0A2S5TGE9_9GAMM|nr:flavin-dependent monooxygenase [Solimonas fluminis]PPE74034.1 flavin-dependent monooxygenase [Solimonas fluminis]